MVNLESKLQKNRFFKKPKKNLLKFGNSGFLVIKEGRLELIQLSILKKLIKKLIKKKKNEKNMDLNKIWFSIKPNFILQRKSKNSRMGKGKGMFERRVIRVNRGFILFEFSGFSINKLKFIINIINKLLSIKLVLINTNSNFYPL
jgi:large subunit ribosomal protein L16